MAFYESVFIARQDITAQQAEAIADTFAKVVTDAGGKVAKRENWGLRALSYRIKKNRKGHYLLFNFDSPSDAITEMERQMRLNEDVLRYLTLRLDELDEGPSIMMQNRERSDRGDRGDRGDRDSRNRGFDSTSSKDGTASASESPEAKTPSKADGDKAEDSKPEDAKAEPKAEDRAAKAADVSEGDNA